MIKNNAIKRIILATLIIFIAIFIYFFPDDDKKLYLETEKYIDAIKMPLYAINSDKYISRIDILKPSENVLDNIKYIINSLTISTKESEFIRTGFFPIIPKNTKLIDYSLKDNILKLNFSKEFLNIDIKYEESLIESIIYSLCEFKEVKEIMIFIEGEKLTNLPNSKKILPLTLNKDYGINKVYDFNNIKNVIKTTTYYLEYEDEEKYYIPITKYENNNLEKIDIIINNLKTSPINQTNLISYLRASASLESYNILEDNILLSFNNNIIADLSSMDILEEVKYTIFLSARDTYDIKNVIFDIKSEKVVSLLN